MKKFLGKCGQTSIEYLLMIMVVVVIIMNVMQQVKAYIFAEQGNCQPESKSLVCHFELLLQPGFERFKIMR